MMTRDDELNAIAGDLALCDLGLVLAKGALRKRYLKHRAACMARIQELDPLGPDDMTDTDSLLVALLS